MSIRTTVAMTVEFDSADPIEEARTLLEINDHVIAYARLLEFRVARGHHPEEPADPVTFGRWEGAFGRVENG